MRRRGGQGSCIGEGNGNPLQDSRLENPMDRGAWRATVHGVHGVAKSQTRLSAGQQQPRAEDRLQRPEAGGARSVCCFPLFPGQAARAARGPPGVLGPSCFVNQGKGPSNGPLRSPPPHSSPNLKACEICPPPSVNKPPAAAAAPPSNADPVGIQDGEKQDFGPRLFWCIMKSKE